MNRNASVIARALGPKQSSQVRESLNPTLLRRAGTPFGLSGLATTRIWICFTLFFFLRTSFGAFQPKILFEEDPALLVSDFEIVVLTGSADDPLEKVGLSNLYSELMLRGTKKKERTKFQSELEKMGASLSVSATQDKIIFEGRVIKENTFPFLKLIEDCLLHPAFSPKEFESLKTEILAEIANFKNANNRLGGVTARRELYSGTSLERPVIGTISTVKAIKLEDVQRAYNNHFHRANFVFAVASSLKESDLQKPLTDIWLALPDGANHAPRNIIPKVPSQPSLILIHKPKTSTGALVFAQAGITAQDPDRYILSVGNFSFGAEPLVSRLFRTIRAELGWTYAIWSTYNATGGLSNQTGMYFISSTPSVEFTTKTLLKLLSMWKEYMKTGLNADEMRLAKESLINSYPFEFDSAMKRLGQKLHSYLYKVPMLSADEYAKTIEAIDNEKLVKALSDRQNANGWVIALVADKDIIEKQLAEEQKDIPQEKRIVISKVITPDNVVE